MRTLSLSLTLATLTISALPVAAWAEEAPATSPTHEEMVKKVAELEKAAAAMKGLKFTGYVQARYELGQDSVDGVKSDGKTPTNNNRFYVRRSRFKVTHKTDMSEVYFQFDATASGIALKDAAVAVTEPWSPVKATVIMGQYSTPFGFEVPRSPVKNEFMERSTMMGKLFPNEVDRGVGVSGSYKLGEDKSLAFNLGLLNGNGTLDNETKTYAVDEDGNLTAISTVSFSSGARDRDSKKDFYGRVAVDTQAVSAGVSLYQGQYGQIPPLTMGEDGYEGGDTLTFLPKTRLGVDLQAHHTFAKSLGMTEVRVEYIQGHGWFEKDKESDTDFTGYYATLIQGLGKYAGVGVRYDTWDPDTASELDEEVAIEPVLLFYPNKPVRITTSYRMLTDHKGTDGADKPNNVLAIQFQGSF